jgi:tripartite-type tricarboxylate transporter receptor subunit TctC
MKTGLRCLTGLLATTALLSFAANAAERFPVKPVRFVVPYPPGGGSDLTGRAVGQKLSESLRQTFVIDNRAGATGLIGTELVAKAPADGYTILLASAPHTINSLVYTKVRYEAVKDFTPINLIATSPQALLAHPSFAANTLKELLAMPRAQTEKFAMGSNGLASLPHMTYEWLRLKTGLTLVHVPYKGGGPSLAAATAGQIPLTFQSVPGAIPHIKAGRLKVLGITSPQRHPLLPDSPTFQEAGVKDFFTFQWYGVMGPAGMPKGVVAMLNREINQALGSPDIKERFTSLTLDVTPGTPENFRELLTSEVARWKEVLKQVHVQLD